MYTGKWQDEDKNTQMVFEYHSVLGLIYYTVYGEVKVIETNKAY